MALIFFKNAVQYTFYSNTFPLSETQSTVTDSADISWFYKTHTPHSRGLVAVPDLIPSDMFLCPLNYAS